MPSRANDPSTPRGTSRSNSADSIRQPLSPESPASSNGTSISSKTGEEKDELLAAENPFDNEASRVLFNAIDEIWTHGAGKYVDIPQLIVVGGQSTGKSSLLQTLTDFPFPIGGGCCTRFATRIVSRRTAPGTKSQVRISIASPDFKIDKLSEVPKESYAEFSHVKESFTAEEFADVIREASTKYMKINPGRSGIVKKNFAAEVLKVEISGPARSQFSILDIPGIFTNSASVKDGEMDAVTEMVRQYMLQPTNIVICIAAGNNDIADQGIFEMARHYVNETRLIGVFTKCDRLTKEEIDSVVAHANGRVEGVPALKYHGWFVVRNRSAEDEGKPDFAAREAEAELFQQPAWAEIHAKRKGSTMLRRYLGEVLCNTIKSTFPRLSAEIRQKLKEAQTEKAALGEARISHDQRRSYLGDIAQKYEEACTRALGNPWQLGVDDAMVRIKIREQNESFDLLMRNEGHEYAFEDHGLEREDCLRRMHQIVQGDAAKPKEGPEIIAKIEEEVIKCSSTTLPGMVHPEIIQRLYNVQTQKWRAMAETHLTAAASTVSRGTKAILEMVCPRRGETILLHDELWLMLANFHEAALDRAMTSLGKYCDGDQAKPLQTTDPAFEHKLRLLKTLRVFRSFEQATMAWANNKTEVLNGQKSAEFVGELLYDAMHSSSLNNIINDVHDTLKVYYEFSLQSFIRYVVTNVIEDFLGYVDGPLKGFTRKYVEQLPVAEIDRLGQETHETADKREQLENAINSLQAAEAAARSAIANASNVD